jgi:putative membrane protein
MNALKLAQILLIAHAGAVGFALIGLLVAIPNPQLWAGIPGAPAIYAFGMQYAGALHIVLGAAALFCFGGAVLGWGRTAFFFVASCALSLGMELLGTGTGWPFGAYEYTSGLGFKVLGRVPFSIPLSWFYMGLTSYLLAHAMLERVAPRAPAWAAVALGVWLLTAWDLVLDPAMAHEALAIRFWVWHETGPYMGMPLINFAGWAMTGALFMGLSRLAWRASPPDDTPVQFPFFVYGINMVFAIALSASVALWLPIFLALALGVAPACLAWRRGVPPAGAVTAT